MSDLLKGLTAGGWGGLFAWIAPNTISIALLWFFVYEPMTDAPLSHLLRSLEPGQLCVALFAIAATVGVLASAASTPLYRLLEGYAWPGPLRRYRAGIHRKRKEAVKQRVDAAPQGWEKGLYLEKLARYPLDDRQVVPTRLGNAIRAFETYGKTRFNLDSQTLWSELCSLVPKYLQNELDRSRAIVDFFVALFYACFSAAILSIVAGISGFAMKSNFVFGALMLLASWGAYEMAVRSCAYWRATVQALVDLGRVDLAKGLGLKLPATLSEEREMWGYVTSYVYYGNVTTGEKLDAFRAGKPEPGQTTNSLARIKRALHALIG
jgi:hypothetical protein